MKEYRVKSIEDKSLTEYTKKLTLEMNRMTRQGFTWSLDALNVVEATTHDVFRAILSGERVKPPTAPKGGEASDGYQGSVE